MSGTHVSDLIRVSSRALGPKRRVIVRVYESCDDMRRAAMSFNGNDHSESGAVTQAYCDTEGRITVPIIRLTPDYLTTQIVGHELHHATCAIYGSTLTDESVSDVLTHHNEPFAHLYSDLLRVTTNALYAHGYWGSSGGDWCQR